MKKLKDVVNERIYRRNKEARDREKLREKLIAMFLRACGKRPFALEVLK